MPFTLSRFLEKIKTIYWIKNVLVYSPRIWSEQFRCLPKGWVLRQKFIPLKPSEKIETVVAIIFLLWNRVLINVFRSVRFSVLLVRQIFCITTF